MRMNASEYPSFTYLVDASKETIVPVAQRRRVMRADILEVDDAHIGVLRHGPGHIGNRRQAAAGKDVALNEIDAVLVLS